jgi:hypothetical protein
MCEAALTSEKRFSPSLYPASKMQHSNEFPEDHSLRARFYCEPAFPRKILFLTLEIFADLESV